MSLRKRGVCRLGVALIIAGVSASLPVTAAAAPARTDDGESGAPFYATTFEKTPVAAEMARVGRALFFDNGLSASGNLACASCHDPARAFGPPDAAAVRRGGGDGRQVGLRAVPGLTYTHTIPPFTEHFFDDEGDDSVDQGPAGGRTWDGRAQSAHDQARLPLLSPLEMANADLNSVVVKVERAAYADLFRRTFGDKVFENPGTAFKAVLMALETYQQTPDEFYPFTSKYDAWLRRRVSLTTAEARGLAVFNDPARGNCARCHPSAVRGGALPLFTDFGYAGIGAPRNRDIPANTDPHYYDLGLCGPLRTDLAAKTRYCGMFRTPSLRNVALRRVLFHNGVVHRLDDAVRFYAERDTRPENWYPRGPDGVVRKYDDVPAPYRQNLDMDVPFGSPAGGPPTLSERDVADIVSFLNTLTDGFDAGR